MHIINTILLADSSLCSFIYQVGNVSKLVNSITFFCKILQKLLLLLDYSIFIDISTSILKIYNLFNPYII